MHRITRVFVIAAVAVLALTLLPAAAYAQGSSTATPTADTSEVTYEIQLWPEGDPGISIVIVGVRLPDSTKLPVRVRLPLPAEAQVFWAGESYGGEAQEDVPRDFVTVPGEGGSSIEFTLEETLTAQYDAFYRAMNVDRGAFSVALDWVQTEPAGQVSFAVRVPTATEDVSIEPDPPGSPRENLMGERLYTMAPMTLAPGDQTRISVSYTRPELAGGTQEFPLIPVLGGALALAVVVLLIAIARQGRSREPEADE